MPYPLAHANLKSLTTATLRPGVPCAAISSASVCAPGGASICWSWDACCAARAVVVAAGGAGAGALRMLAMCRDRAASRLRLEVLGCGAGPRDSLTPTGGADIRTCNYREHKVSGYTQGACSAMHRTAAALQLALQQLTPRRGQHHVDHDGQHRPQIRSAKTREIDVAAAPHGHTGDRTPP